MSSRGATRRHGALIASVLAGLLTFACGSDGDELTGQAVVPMADAGGALADLAVLPVHQASSFDDLPGVAGLGDLPEHLQRQVLERANNTACQCGCVGHSIAQCLRREEDCEVALRLARTFIADAEAVRALGSPTPTPEPEPELPAGSEPAGATGPDGPMTNDAGERVDEPAVEGEEEP